MIRYNSTLNNFEGYYSASWIPIGGVAGGSNTQVQYNNAGALAGSSAFTFDGTTLTVPKIAFASSNTPSLTNYQGGAIVSGSTQASTSGTSINFTSIPSWVKRITVMFTGVSTNGSSVPFCQIQIGSGSLATTGYESNSYTLAGSATGTASTTGFLVRGSGANLTASGQMVLTLLDAATYTWVASHIFSDNTNTQVYTGGGTKALSGTLDRVSVVSTDTFDAGSINILYE
jgi:hypothetical protein